MLQRENNLYCEMSKDATNFEGCLLGLQSGSHRCHSCLQKAEGHRCKQWERHVDKFFLEFSSTSEGQNHLERL